MQAIVRLARWVRAKCHSGITSTPPQLRLVGQLALGAKRHLSLVEVGGVQFLVGGGVEHITVIVPVLASNLCPTENLPGAGKPHAL